MSKVLTTLFVFLSSFAFSYAQNQEIFNIKHLPGTGILLDKGWLYHVGDDPLFAQPAYDDSNWQPVNPNQDIHKLPFLKNGIVWFRLRLSLDSIVRSQQLSLSIQQSGATEMFLNGKFIRRYGEISQDPKKIRAYSPLGKPMTFPISGDSEQLLAIRYALQPGISYTTLFGLRNPGIRARLSTFERASEQFENLHTKEAGKGFFAIGVYFLFTILHLAFFIFYPSQKSNLYFSIFSFGWTLSWISGGIVPNINHIELWYPLIGIQYIVFISSSIMFVTAVYRLFQIKIDWKYYAIFIYGIATVPWILLTYDKWTKPAIVFNLLYLFRIAQISIGAMRNQKKGAWIIAAGSIVCFISWFVFGIPEFFKLTIGQSNLIFMVAQMTPPLAFSIYLSYQFALTHKSLQKNLSEVKRLSAEKQQILTSQNEMLEKQVEQRTVELQHSLQELKSTQAQLIQSEKMASLGELTAGIAHEIQNPLNFVNNFSEVNTELIDELQRETNNGNLSEIKSIAASIKENEQKINQHGKRADAIVKGMLQHSRISTGQKEPTDINAISDEYLRLAYHGFRAKEKDFNAQLKTSFDGTIGKINVVPQELGRVLLNLYNNAFYAVSEKKKLLSDARLPDGQGYEPTITVSTERSDGTIKITVKDNGNGISEKIRDKIFQPFFTTKPTGEGTGLGLSLAYDIVTKGHGGDLQLNAKEGEGSEFSVQLPVNKFNDII